MHCPSSLRATLVLLSGALALASCLLIIGWRQVGRRVHHARLGLAGLIMLVLLELAALSALHWANGAHQKPRNGCTHTHARAQPLCWPVPCMSLLVHSCIQLACGESGQVSVFLCQMRNISDLLKQGLAAKEAYKLCHLHQKLFTNTSSSEVRSVEEACDGFSTQSTLSCM